jgi:hypothetical protein
MLVGLCDDQLAPNASELFTNDQDAQLILHNLQNSSIQLYRSQQAIGSINLKQQLWSVL